MADKKITDFTSLTEATISAANDVLVIVDATGPETKKATVSAIVGAGLLAGVGEAHIDNIEINGNAIISTDTNGNIDLTPNGSGEVNISKVDIDSGAIDGTTIGASSAAAGTFTNLTASGTVSFSGATVSNGGSVTTVDINGGTIDGATIGGSTAGAGTFTSAVVNGSGGLGYATGSGGTVTQITSRTTGVTLDKTNGAITLVSAAGTTSWQTFTVTNSTVAATDTVIVSQKSGTDLNMIHVTAVAAGSFNISFATTGGTTTEQPVFNFAVIKAVTA
jgi:hypothetical protein